MSSPAPDKQEEVKIAAPVVVLADEKVAAVVEIKGEDLYDQLRSKAFVAGNERADFVLTARIAELAERHQDMVRAVKDLVLWAVKNKQELALEERNLFSVAYKNTIGLRRSAWRTLSLDDRHADKVVVTYKRLIEGELRAIALECLELLEQLLRVVAVEPSEARVFYLKLSADYRRYLAETFPGEGHEAQATKFYEAALAVAEQKLPVTHPVRLGLALNASVCFFEIGKQKQRACDLAKSAFDAAISKLDELDGNSYKDSALIMQLLRDNYVLWTAEEGGAATAAGAGVKS